MSNLVPAVGLEVAAFPTYPDGDTFIGGRMETFAAKLKRLRTERRLSQEALARLAGMGVGAVRDYEQGKKEPSFRYALMLAKALGVDCRELEFEVSMRDAGQAEAPPPAKKSKKRKGDAR